MIAAALTLAIGATGGIAQQVEAAIQPPSAQTKRVAAPRRFCADVPMTDHRGP